MVDTICDYYASMERFPVRSQVPPGYLSELIPSQRPGAWGGPPGSHEGRPREDHARFGALHSGSHCDLLCLFYSGASASTFARTWQCHEPQLQHPWATCDMVCECFYDLGPLVNKVDRGNSSMRHSNCIEGWGLALAMTTGVEGYSL